MHFVAIHEHQHAYLCRYPRRRSQHGGFHCEYRTADLDQSWGCVGRTCGRVFLTCRPGIKSRRNDSRNSPVVHCAGRIYAHPKDRLRQTDKYSRRQCHSPEGDSFSLVRLTLVVPPRRSRMSSDRTRRPVPGMPKRSTNSTVWYGGQLMEDIDCRQDQIKKVGLGFEFPESLFGLRELQLLDATAAVR